MSLSYQMDSLDGIENDVVKGLYSEKDGKYYLDINGVIPTSQFDAKTTELNGKVSEIRRKADEYMNKLKGFGEYTPESIEALNQKVSELQILADGNKSTNEDVEAKIKANKEYYDTRLGDIMTKNAEKVLQLENLVKEKESIILDSKLEKVVIDEVKDVAKSESLIDVLALMKDKIVWNADIEQFESKEDGLSVKELSEKFFKERPYFVKESTGGGATGNQNKQMGENPFSEKGWNRTKQAEMFKSNPERAKILQEQALKKMN